MQKKKKKKDDGAKCPFWTLGEEKDRIADRRMEGKWMWRGGEVPAPGPRLGNNDANELDQHEA